jgi:signal transduction histidine kinase
LTLLIGLLLTTVVGASAVALYVSERRLLVRQMESTRDALVSNFAQACRDAVLVGDELAAASAASAIARAPGVRAAYGVDGAGRVRFHSTPGQAGRAPDPLGSGEVAVERDASSGVDPRGRVVVVFSREALEAEVSRALGRVARRIGWVSLSALLLGLLGAVGLARSITRPLLRIAEGTHAVAEGKLDHRLNMARRDELGRLAADFDRMAERLGELDQLKRDFSANVTHELRSPISAIESYANRIAELARAGRSAEIVEDAAVVRNNASRLGGFINDLLDVSKIEAKAVEIAPEALDAAEALRDVATLFGPRAGEKGLDLRVGDVPPGLTVWADPDKLRQVLTNLVGNALKFTPAGGRITLGAAAESGGVRMSVADTGPGIAPADQARIFQRFEQVRGARDEIKGMKGTGLGLAIARGLVAAHGGRMDLKSELGRGSEFSAWFPEES